MRDDGWDVLDPGFDGFRAFVQARQAAGRVAALNTTVDPGQDEPITLLSPSIEASCLLWAADAVDGPAGGRRPARQHRRHLGLVVEGTSAGGGGRAGGLATLLSAAGAVSSQRP